MGATASLLEEELAEDWVDMLVQPDFHGRLQSRAFLQSLLANPSAYFRWPAAGISGISLTDEQVAATQTTLKDYRLATSVSNAEDSSYSEGLRKYQEMSV